MSEGKKCVFLNVIFVTIFITVALVFAYHWAFVFVVYLFLKMAQLVEDTIEMTED